MKLKHPLLVFLVTLGALGMEAAEKQTNQVSAYEQAVMAYVESAGKELAALRAQADAVTKDAPAGVKARYQEFYARLDKCDKLAAELGEAGSKDFDPLKARYEKQRQEALEALSRASSS